MSKIKTDTSSDHVDDGTEAEDAFNRIKTRINERFGWFFAGRNALPTPAELLPFRIQVAISRAGMDESVLRSGRSAKQLGRYQLGGDVPAQVLVGLAEASALSVGWLISGRAESRADAEAQADVLANVAGAAVSSKSIYADVLKDRFFAAVEEAKLFLPTIYKPSSLVANGPGPGLMTAHGADFALLPRYDVSASAGFGRVVEQEGEIERLAFRYDWLRDMGISPQDAGLVTAHGDSMLPTIPDGALMLVVRGENEQIRSGFIYVIVLNGEVMVKRISRNVDGTIDLISDNSLYPVQKVQQVDFERLFVAGRVFWIGHKL